VNSQHKWLQKNVGLAGVLRAGGTWLAEARLKQYPLLLGEPAIWLVVGGRGSGKTRLGAEWVNALVRGLPPFAARRHGRIALVGETLADAREVMIEGVSGILTTARGERPRYEATRRRLLWENGAVAQVFSSEDPESLRGPQFEAAWCDELAKWKHPEECFDMLQFGLRLGENPRQIVTTTPKPVPLLRRLLEDPSVTVTHMRTAENAGNLARPFLETMEKRYAGTRLGRQELDGELIEERADALWSRAMLEEAALRPRGALQRVVVAVDPPASANRSSDACGIVAAGLDDAGNAVVLADASVKAAKPRAWASAAVALYHRLEADCIVAEVNQGGDMVTAVLATVDPSVPVRARRAHRGKWLRAEPVAALYEQGRVAHAARFPELEYEMCDFGPDGLSNGRSPDRLDALVWAIGELLLGGKGEPRVRGMG
jgi:phage terminase large subunit-like protein